MSKARSLLLVGLTVICGAGQAASYEEALSFNSDTKGRSTAIPRAVERRLAIIEQKYRQKAGGWKGPYAAGPTSASASGPIRTNNELGRYTKCIMWVGSTVEEVISWKGVFNRRLNIALGYEYQGMKIKALWDPVNIKFADAYSVYPELFKGQLTHRSERFLKRMWSLYVNRDAIVKVAINHYKQSVESAANQENPKGAWSDQSDIAFGYNAVAAVKGMECFSTFVRRMAELAEIYIPEQLREQSELELLQ